MKKVVILIIVVLLLIGLAIGFAFLKNDFKKEDKAKAETEEQSNVDPDVDIDLDSIPLDLTDNEKKEFNKLFEKYDGKVLSQEETADLIDLVIETNDEYLGDGKRFVSIDDGNYSARYNRLYMRCLDANPYYGGDNTERDVEDAKWAMEKFKESLKEDKEYEITIIKGRDMVVEIKIVEV